MIEIFPYTYWHTLFASQAPPVPGKALAQPISHNYIQQYRNDSKTMIHIHVFVLMISLHFPAVFLPIETVQQVVCSLFQGYSPV